ncbi:JmjC domain, hydroxylase [Ceratobasidium sp. AG-Ba]|nr:JmjC domain, hydroxylase [Ceratobasidium sp. AG-Ba]
MRTSVRLVERSAGSPTKSEAEADDHDDTNNLGSGSAPTIPRGQARGRGGRGRGGRAASRTSDVETRAAAEKPKRGTSSRGRARGGRGKRASSEAPRRSARNVESEVESEEEQPGPRQRDRRSSSRPPESGSESESDPELVRHVVALSRARGGASSKSKPKSTAMNGEGRRVSNRKIVAAPLSTGSSISLGGNYDVSASSVLESVASADSALGPRLRRRAFQARVRNGSGTHGRARSPFLDMADSPSLGGSVDLPLLDATASISLGGTRSDVGTVVSETTAVEEVEVVLVERSARRNDRSPVRMEWEPVVRKGVSPVRGGRSPTRPDRSPIRVERSPVRKDKVSPSRRNHESAPGQDRESPRRGRDFPSRRDSSRHDRESPSRRDRESPSRRDRESPSRRDRESPSRQNRDSKHESPRREEQQSADTSKLHRLMEAVLPRHGSKHSAIATPAKLVRADSSRSPQNVFLVLPKSGIFPQTSDDDEEPEAGNIRRRSRGDKDRDVPAKRSRVDKGKGKAAPEEPEIEYEIAETSTTGRRQSRRQSKPSARALESAQHQEQRAVVNHGIRITRSRSRASSAVSEPSVIDKKNTKRRRDEHDEPSSTSKRYRASTEGGSTHSKATQSQTPMIQLRDGDFILRLQKKRCFYYNWDQNIMPRCLACRQKQAGDSCRFVNIRYLKITSSSLDLFDVVFDSPQNKEQPDYHLPPTWNTTPEIEQVDRLRNVIARALYHVLEEEFKHASKANAIWRPVEIEFRATCEDVCATSIFASCHMCTRCGRELCGECYQELEKICPAGTSTQYEHIGRKNRQTHKYRTCGYGAFHVPSNFRPITRFIRDDLEGILKDMSEFIEELPPTTDQLQPRPQPQQRGQRSTAARIQKWMSRVPPWNPVSPQASTEPPALSEAGSSHDVSSLRGTPDPQLSPAPVIASPTMSPNHEHGISPEVSVKAGKRHSAPQPVYIDPANLPSHPIHYFSKDITEEKFKPLWATGQAMVVQGLLDSFKIDWTPEYFIDRYGGQECFVVDCKTDKSTLSSVEEFFSQFGDPDRGDEILKLKDWPAQADFRDDFPDLFKDFMNALPIPNYTRRDGILNVASHFATNAIAPDLGPKMYNAFASNEGPGGQGSTRLHMDMADAVNIMMYANNCKDGKPGTAVWDIFQAADADKIRDYLRRHFDSKTTKYRDPIHSQMFYLDSDHRRRLFEEEGVYSWRIYQRPGEAVFIPAGCAHQVCNLADCIKVAIDFVSLENIDRCEKLTAEFRNENDTFTWKEDVLQLRTMMMYAWHSATQLRRAWEEEVETAGV